MYPRYAIWKIALAWNVKLTVSFGRETRITRFSVRFIFAASLTRMTISVLVEVNEISVARSYGISPHCLPRLAATKGIGEKKNET